MDDSDAESEAILERAIDCPVLVTERLVLRAPHAEDVEDLVRLANNRRVAEMLRRMPHPYGPGDAEAFLAGPHGRPGGCVYAITLAQNGRFLGCCGLELRDGRHEIGYWLGEPHWGNGYATEAAQAVVDLAFRATAIDMLHTSCRVTNAASRHVIHKCGFQYAGQGMIDSLVAGRVPSENYVLDRATWIGLRSWSGTA